MKIFFVVLLAAILAIGLVPLTAFAEVAEVEPPVENPAIYFMEGLSFEEPAVGESVTQTPLAPKSALKQADKQA